MKMFFARERGKERVLLQSSLIQSEFQALTSVISGIWSGNTDNCMVCCRTLVTNCSVPSTGRMSLDADEPEGRVISDMALYSSYNYIIMM